MKNTKKKGFTIVELVIVVAVIAILSAILIPTFSGLVASSKDAALQENLRNAYVEYTAEAAAKGDYEGQETIIFSKANDNTAVYYVYATTGPNAGKYEEKAATNYALSEVSGKTQLDAVEVGDKDSFNGYYAFKVHA